MCSSTPTTSQCWRRWSIRCNSSAVELAWTKEDPISAELLRASEAARRLDMSTNDLLHLVHQHEIRYEMVDGIAHIPSDALGEHRAKAS